jgi:hypothetical protein
MGAAEAEELLETELTTLDVRDGAAVRALAARVEALGDTARISQVCARSNAVRAAVGRLRADALAALLARDERDEFIRRTADREYMAAVELDALRVPRYVAIEPFACPCGPTSRGWCTAGASTARRSRRTRGRRRSARSSAACSDGAARVLVVQAPVRPERSDRLGGRAVEGRPQSTQGRPSTAVARNAQPSLRTNGPRATDSRTAPERTARSVPQA